MTTTRVHCIAILVAFTVASALQIQSVPRVKIFDSDKHYYHEHSPTGEASSPRDLFYETPVLVENVLPLDKCEAICDRLMMSGEDLRVTVQRKTKRSDGNDQPTTRLYECKLSRAIDLMMQSKPDDCFFCFSEGLLDGNGDAMHETIALLTSVRENLFTGNKKAKDHDLFDYFPPEVKPSDCVILAGEGATSTLHRDPFSWTGTSLCLEGSKIWRFVPPPGLQRVITGSNGKSSVSEVDNLMKSYRLPSSAWNRGESGDNEVTISAGWQSDFSLYALKSPGIRSAREWSEEECGSKLEDMTSIAMSTDLLAPSPDIKNNENISIWTVVQNPGDLLVIPAFWWHQTYALEPSLAIASQRCGLHRDTARVIEHILETSGTNEKVAEQSVLLNKHSFADQDPELIVSALFDQLSI
jgi:hypothetical protein